MLTVRSFWAKGRRPAISAAVCAALLCPCPSATRAVQAAQERSYDFSPKQTGDLLQLDAKVWTDINRFAFLIGVDLYPPKDINVRIVDDFSKIEIYPKLRLACRQWATQTFGNLQQVAEELSSGEIRTLLDDLKSAVERRPKDPAGAQEAFKITANKLLPKLRKLDDLTQAVKQDLGELASLSLTAGLQAQTTSEVQWKVLLGTIQPRLKEVLPWLVKFSDRWGAISSDLADLRKVMDAHLDRSKDDFDLSLTIDFGLASWKSLESTAKTFVANVPREKKYLTGEIYYDECPLKENVTYTIQIKRLNPGSNGQSSVLIPVALKEYIGHGFRGATAISKVEMSKMSQYLGPGMLSVDNIVLGSIDTLLPSKRANAYAPTLWRFQRVGRGWWRIVSPYLGEKFALDVTTGGSSLSSENPPNFTGDGFFWPIMVRTQSASGKFPGQYWRCVPTGEDGCFRLYNAFLGEMRTLSYWEFGWRKVSLMVLNNAQTWRIQAVP